MDPTPATGQGTTAAEPAVVAGLRQRIALVGGLCAVDLAVFWEWWHVTRLGGWALAPPVVSLLTFGTLLRRGWRRPLPVFAAIWLVSVLAGLIPGYHPFVAALCGLFLVSTQRSTSVSVPALGSMVVMSALLQLSTIRHLGEPESATAAVLPVLLWSLIAVLVWAVGARARADRRRVEDLQARRVPDAAAAVADERLRIARDLHDIVAHSVSVIVLQAAGARRVLAADPERADRALGVIEQTGLESMQELRRLLGVLRASGGEDAPADIEHQPGLADLDALVDLTCRTGLTARLESTGSPCRLDLSVELAAYRVVQESLTNARKHAGDHARATVRLAWAGEGLAISVDDEPLAPLNRSVGARMAVAGSGETATRVRPLSMGHGLLGLRERVTAIGGAFAAGPTASGFRVIATLPSSTVTEGHPDRARDDAADDSRRRQSGEGLG